MVQNNNYNKKSFDMIKNKKSNLLIYKKLLTEKYTKI